MWLNVVDNNSCLEKLDTRKLALNGCSKLAIINQFSTWRAIQFRPQASRLTTTEPKYPAPAVPLTAVPSFCGATNIATLPHLVDSMSDPSGTSHFQSLFDVALQDYEKKTGTKLADHPLARQLESCDSVESVAALLQQLAQGLNKSRGDDGKVMTSLMRVVHVLYTLSPALGEATVKDVSGNYETLADLLESIEHFLSRLDIYAKLPLTTEMAEVLVKIMVELLSVIALVTKQVRQKRPIKFVKRLLGENEVGAALQRLDRLTQDEARTTAAQTLEVVYGLVQNITAVMDHGQASIEGVQEALEHLQQNASRMNKPKRRFYFISADERF
ncbi:hypothetical protein BC827DRAFT_1155221 [Russula dissimulans]|nr:hypothetical protein BC827DRAFT_1155221 [Russula dissimulans]